MSDKMECPGCKSYTSSVLRAVRDGEPCPYCGLTADAIEAVLAASRKHGETKLVEDLREALKRADKAEAQAGRLRAAMWQIQSGLEEIKDLL